MLLASLGRLPYLGSSYGPIEYSGCELVANALVQLHVCSSHQHKRKSYFDKRGLTSTNEKPKD